MRTKTQSSEFTRIISKLLVQVTMVARSWQLSPHRQRIAEE
jgi:hypothetical protein